MKQKVLVLGAGGQLGRELQRTVPAGVECVPRTRAELDIADASAVAECLADIQPELVVNAAAYTAVDKAESEKAAAHRGNAEAPGVVAAACAQRGLRFIHISTDFVFDGRASEPYRPEAATAPLGEYGRSKLEGEVAVQSALPEALILRTGWVYSSFGGNFVKTMLRLMGERDELGVVTDQVGTPTWAHGLAEAVWAAAARPQLQGIYHWSDAGVCSWYDFAVAICEEALALNLLSKPVKVRPISAAEYPTPAQRPAYSVLDKTSSWRDFAMEGVHWRRQLRAMLADFKELADA
ncbi:MAG: dTDP-4-dehydrorhamnose reductase [Halioglobus sp.]|nr:dTDP-4-dehydrorhamnose reductase [Halioglobus sp.]